MRSASTHGGVPARLYWPPLPTDRRASGKDAGRIGQYCFLPKVAARDS